MHTSQPAHRSMQPHHDDADRSTGDDVETTSVGCTDEVNGGVQPHHQHLLEQGASLTAMAHAYVQYILPSVPMIFLVLLLADVLFSLFLAIRSKPLRMSDLHDLLFVPPVDREDVVSSDGMSTLDLLSSASEGVGDAVHVGENGEPTTSDMSRVEQHDGGSIGQHHGQLDGQPSHGGNHGGLASTSDGGEGSSVGQEGHGSSNGRYVGDRGGGGWGGGTPRGVHRLSHESVVTASMGGDPIEELSAVTPHGRLFQV